jgi:ribonuclease T1
MSRNTRGARTGRRSLVGVLIALITAALVWWTQGDGHTPGSDPSPSDTPSAQQTRSGGRTDPDSGLPIVQVSDLPPEAAETLRLIDAGGPYPYDTDGITFQNREGVLPAHDEGYYEEYTVETPGSDDRGARRIVTGSGDELYWTDDHYSSFSRIAR